MLDAASRDEHLLALELKDLAQQVHATLIEGSALVGAPSVHSQEFTGAGVRVAVLDSGIDTDHTHLSDDIAAQQCFCDTHASPVKGCCPSGGQQEANAEDDEGHGADGKKRFRRIDSPTHRALCSFERRAAIKASHPAGPNMNVRKRQGIKSHRLRPMRKDSPRSQIPTKRSNAR